MPLDANTPNAASPGKRLFHSFPRPPVTVDPSTRMKVRRIPDASDDECGFEILRLILRNGILCTPEEFGIYSDEGTERLEKRVKFLRDVPYDVITQSRACFTLLNDYELAEQYATMINGEEGWCSHSDLFGRFSIGLDPIEAREFGILPAVYYYRFSHSSDAPGQKRLSGLGSQIVQRLDEIRTVFSILAYVEAKTKRHVGRVCVPEANVLEQIGVGVKYEDDVLGVLAELTAEEAERVFRLFDTDRVPAWNVVDFLKMLLSLYQTTDSTVEEAPLAFFQQREWRLVHHMRPGLEWFSLGRQSGIVDSSRDEYVASRREIKKFLAKTSRDGWMGSNESFLRHSWVLAGAGGRVFRDAIRVIVVPMRWLKETRKLVKEVYGPRCALPVVRKLPAPWRVQTIDGRPVIVAGQ